MSSVMIAAGTIGAVETVLTNPTTTRVLAGKDPDLACTFAQSLLIRHRSGTSVG
jgi:hypothetical protein